MVKNFLNLTQEECQREYDKLIFDYENFKSKNLKLDMSRGKPETRQLDLSLKMLDEVNSRSDFKTLGGIDLRNYGICDGLPEMKKFISSVTGVDEKYFIVGGNSSLSMMFDAISFFMIHGSREQKPWCKQEKIKFLCPAPGYDRHFSICEYFGIEMITVKMNKDGPDMDFVEDITKNDSSVKGIWCVPKYSNPQGIVYSDEVVKRFANLKPKAKDFKIFWDNAYFMHDLSSETETLTDILEECKKNRNEEMPIVFYSTSKITFPGAGVAFLACRGENLENLRKMYSIKTVGFDKINQIRHLKFLKNKSNLYNHMQKHREILKPKFELVLKLLESEFKDNPILKWNSPKGGYFISVDTCSGCAKETVRLCSEAGVILTKAGSTFPYGKDPYDTNIRLAPTYPNIKDLGLAVKLFCLCTKLAFLKKKLGLCN